MSDKVDINQIHDEIVKESKEIHESIDSSSDLSSIKIRIIELQNKIKKVSHLLPPYQQLSYSEQIRSLLESVEKKKAPTRRFKFFKRPDSKKSETSTQPKFQPNFEDDFKPNVENVIRVTKTIIDQSKVYCQNVESSVLIFKNLESITLKKVKNSIVFVESKGPCFIFEMEGSQIFVKCHQLRIHNSTHSTISPIIESRNAIIEGCTDLIFKNEEIQVKDFDSPNSKVPSKNFTKRSEAKEDEFLYKQLRDGEGLAKLQEKLN